MKKLLWLALALACAGIPNEPATRGAAPINATFDLRGIGQTPLPFTAGAYTLDSGRVSLHASGTFSDAIMYREVATGVAFRDSIYGTYEIAPDGTYITFHAPDFGLTQYGAGLSPAQDTLVVVWGGYPFVYARRAQ